MDRIYLSPPHMGGQEIEYIKDAFAHNWIAPAGPALDAFEQAMAAYIGVKRAVAVSSGTAAIHLALRYLDVNAGDTVFCSDLTFAGSCNPILYQNATPVFIDSEPTSWNMSPLALQKAFDHAIKTNQMPKAVIIVDLYGVSADYDKLLPLCKQYNIPVIEDAAEAVGAEYHGQIYQGKCGSFGDIAILSFNGNKIITTSGGGMVLSNNTASTEKMRFWSTQAKEPFIHYEHKEYGYNYRMSNICAAIGRGQLEYLESKIALRKAIYERYRQAISGLSAQVKAYPAYGITNYWLTMLTLANSSPNGTAVITPDELVNHLQQADIEARPAWKPMHMQPVFQDCACYPHYETDFVSSQVFKTTVCLPSGDGMTAEQQEMVIATLNVALLNHQSAERRAV